MHCKLGVTKFCFESCRDILFRVPFHLKTQLIQLTLVSFWQYCKCSVNFEKKFNPHARRNFWKRWDSGKLEAYNNKHCSRNLLKREFTMLETSSEFSSNLLFLHLNVILESKFAYYCCLNQCSLQNICSVHQFKFSEIYKVSWIINDLSHAFQVIIIHQEGQAVAAAQWVIHFHCFPSFLVI